MNSPAVVLTPRKSPLQTRSVISREALHVAAIQVLTREGLVRCTTTRIAERAGMSVGSLYQYYPNRDALLAAVLGTHLVGLAEAIERICDDLSGKAVEEIAPGLTATFLAAKLRNLKESKALYAIASERGGAELVARVSPRMVKAMTTLLASARDVRFDNPAVVATVALSAVLGTIRAVLEGYAPAKFEIALERQVTLLLTAYLRSCALERAG